MVATAPTACGIETSCCDASLPGTCGVATAPTACGIETHQPTAALGIPAL